MFHIEPLTLSQKQPPSLEPVWFVVGFWREQWAADLQWLSRYAQNIKKVSDCG